MSSSYDLVVAYRVYPGLSRTPLLFKDKLVLTEVCLASFKKSLDGLRVKFFAILNNCPPEYEALFRRYFCEPDLEIIKLSAEQNLKGWDTFDLQFDILLGQNYSELVYFADDDFFYVGRVADMVGLMREDPKVDFVTPWDGADYYRLDLHNFPVRLFHAQGRHWREVDSSGMVFLTRKSSLRSSEWVYRKHKTHHLTDLGLHLALTKKVVFDVPKLFRYFLEYVTGQSLWFFFIFKAWMYAWPQILFGKRYRFLCPVPTIATHMENDANLPLGFEWEKIITQFAQTMMTHH